MDSKTGEFNRRWAAMIVEFCVRKGIDHFFVAPGSRCTPLTLAIAQHSKAKVVQHFDERGLAFACQGYGRATNRPGAFVCTSGTAVANALPAVVEAFMENVPMLLLTADRPPELHGIGANQTIPQQNIFGQFTRSFVNADCFEGDDDKGIAILRRAIHSDNCQGPIQLNCMFREPFGTSDQLVDLSALQFPDAANGIDGESETDSFKLPEGETIVVLGRCRNHEADHAKALADRIGAPLLADVSSGLRNLAYDLALLRNDLPRPKNVIHLGGRFVSKRLLQFLDQCPISHYWHVDRFADSKIDPVRKVTRFIGTEIPDFCRNVDSISRSLSDFAREWHTKAADAQRIATETIDACAELSEPSIARDVGELIPTNHGLFLGNSMPVRDMDMFGFWPIDRRVFVATNRGASGIDGLLASSVGFACGLQKPTTIIVGDLSALHDLNSLDLLRRSEQPITLIVINNDGGGIFHFLPVANQTKHFETYFGTPHGLSFANAAEQFQLPYNCCSTRSEFRKAYAESVGKRTCVLEVPTNRVANHQLHMKINRAIQATTP